jgi:hypothetical protein
MRFLRPLPAALTLFALATPALAGTTSEVVWALFQAGIAEAGGNLTATASRRGDGLVLTRGRIDLGDGAVMELPDFTLRQSAEGVVTLELPPRFPLVIDLPPNDEAPDRMSLTVAAPDLVASFTDIGPEVVDVALSATSISVALDPLDKSQLSLTAPPDMALALAAADLSVVWQSVLSEVGESRVSAKLGLGTLHADMRVDIPSEGTKGSMALDLSALSGTLDGLLPAGAQATLDALDNSGGQNPDHNPIPALIALLEDGMHLTGKAETGPMALVFDLPTSPDGPVAMDFTAASGLTEVVVDRRGLLYDIGTGALALRFKGRTPEIPVDEFTLGLADMRETLRLEFPTADKPSPGWGVLYRMTGLTVSDNLWDLGDPGRGLPRDPMALVLDMAGTYTPDPRLMAGTWVPGPEENPFTAATFGLTEALVEGLGVRFTGTGDLAFDFTDTAAQIDGVPVPEGKLSFLTVGANTTIDRLSKMGLIPEDELSGLRFGLMFLGRAVPGVEDQLATEVEFKDGGFHLNGQKIR